EGDRVSECRGPGEWSGRHRSQAGAPRERPQSRLGPLRAGDPGQSSELPGQALTLPLAGATRDAPGSDCLLEVSHVSKAFPGVFAVDDVSLRVEPASVHALIGENGAGKSTLMKIIAGIIPADAGELHLLGRPLQLGSPRQALESGIAMIHQELNLMPSLSVAENIWIGREPLNALGMTRHGELHRRTRALLERLRIDIDPQTEIRRLSIAQRQLIEIARALSYESALLIMDEPTSALTERDAAHLFT